VVLLCGWAANQWSHNQTLDRRRSAFRFGTKLAVGLDVADYLVVVGLYVDCFRLPGLYPSPRLRGWSRLAKDIDLVRRELPGGEDLLVITQGHRFLTSELAFYLRDQPRVYLFNPKPGSIESQYDLWQTPGAHLGRDALLIVSGGPADLFASLTNCFESIAIHDILRYPAQRRGMQNVTLAVGRNVQSWPDPER
jgi:hypothetical protein